ncbi:MAG: TolB family protein [Bacteroidales bacterium]
MKHIFSLLFVILTAAANIQAQRPAYGNTGNVKYDQEDHFKNIRQLTFGGDNAEAYWSFNDDKLIFQATNPAWNAECDQIFITDVATSNMKKYPPELVSTGHGRTTCSYFLPGDTTILYASTHEHDAACPHKPPREIDGNYVWPIYDSYDIYVSDLDGNIIRQLTDEPGYDAEATVSPTGDRIVFTSIRTGDLELFTMNPDGSDVRQVTDQLGYDGGAFFSPDGTKLVFRASRPTTEAEIKKYKDLLRQGLVMPTEMEIFVCDVDGSNLQQVTSLGKANWSPFFHPSGEKIIFSSNHAAARGFKFNLFMIDVDGTNLEQISYDSVFDAFPVFSNDGKYLVFSSNRNNGGTFDTNLFLVEWQE